MQHLILVRHSLPQIDPTLPAPQWILSPEGRRRCRPLADALAPYRPTTVVCSVEPKATETAAMVAAHLGIRHSPAPGLHEHARQTTGYLAAADFQRTVERFFALPDTLVFGEETAWQAQVRFVEAVGQATRHHPQQTLVIVAHGTVLALFAAHYTGMNPFPLWQQLCMPSFLVFATPGYCLATIEAEFIA